LGHRQHAEYRRYRTNQQRTPNGPVGGAAGVVGQRMSAWPGRVIAMGSAPEVDLFGPEVLWQHVPVHVVQAVTPGRGSARQPTPTAPDRISFEVRVFHLSRHPVVAATRHLNISSWSVRNHH